ncbi:MAG: TrkH family potassium uptake protein [Candidatus Brocadiia bacterium]
MPQQQVSQRRRLVARAVQVVEHAASVAVLAGVAARFGTAWGSRHAGMLERLDLAVLAFFAASVAVRLALAERRLAHLRSRWFDAVVVLAAVHSLWGVRAAWAWYLGRQVAATASRLLGTRRVQRLVSQLRLHPAKLMVASFAAAIAVGTLLLLLPAASATGWSIGVVDALFTATSAVCVTGLIVKDTGSDFTLFGQLVILVLLQLGGLGIMTFSAVVVMAFGRTLSKSREVVMQDLLDQDSVREMLALLRFIALSTLLVEAVGAAALFAALGPRLGYSVGTFYTAIFHAVSAFCNAGFSLFTTSMEQFTSSASITLVMAALIVAGGLGFPVLRDLAMLGRLRRASAGRPARLRVQTKVVLATSAVLLVVGTVVFYATEAEGTLAGMSRGQRLLASFFQAVTARTAGFNTVRIGQVGSAGLLLLMVLMFVGASPGSTGGGVKTTTAAILWQAMRSALRQRRQVEFFDRTVPPETVRRAVALVVLSALVLVVWMVALMSVEEQSFEALAFEATSAFGTVGLSTGATPRLTEAGRLLVTTLMFVGRLGPLTLALSFLGEARPAAYAYPEERIMIG